MIPQILYPLMIACSLLEAVLANTEKIIITGPPIAPAIPGLLDSKVVHNIPKLTPDDWSVRHHIPAVFPSDTHPDGLASWYLLSDLTPGQGYEIRICWAATQPTAFKLFIHSPTEVFDDPSLSESLTSFSASRMETLGLDTGDPTKDSAGGRPGQADVGSGKSTLLLRIFAAAEYFSANATLMSHVPPVFVDVILDPHVVPGVPRSLVPTIGSVVVVALGSFFLARIVSSGLGRIAAGSRDGIKKKQ